MSSTKSASSKARFNKKKPNQPNSPDERFSTRALRVLLDPSNQKKIGIAAGVIALGGYAMAQSGKSKKKRTPSATDPETYRGPPALAREEVDSLYASAIESLQRKSNERTPMGGDDDSGLTREFEEFYTKIKRGAPPSQYPSEVRCTIAEFLIVHARFENIASQNESSRGPPPLSVGQASDIRSWVSFESTYGAPQISLTVIANRIDILYRVAMAQKSVSDLRRLHAWMRDEFPSLTQSTDTSDDNFFAIYVQHRFLLACLLGLWDEARTYSIPLDNIILPRSRMKLKQSFTQRALSRPHAQCNFNQIIVNLEDLSSRFPLSLRPPVRFETWPIELFKFRKTKGMAVGVEGNGVQGLPEQTFEWQYFIAPGIGGRGGEGIVRQMYVFGCCVQFISPIQGHTGNLPVTGSWNDSDMSVGMEWTFNATPSAAMGGPESVANAVYVRKNVQFDLERVGHSSMEEIGEMIGDDRPAGIESDEVMTPGWLWRGTMTVISKQGHPNIATGKLDFDKAIENVYEAVVVVNSRD